MEGRTVKDPLHPGRIVHRTITEGLGLSVTDAAQSLKISRKHLSSIMNEHSGISPEMAIRLEKGIGSTAEAWLWMQLNYDLARARKTEKNIKVEKLISTNL